MTKKSIITAECKCRRDVSILRVQYSFRNACHGIKRRSKNLIKSHFVVLFSYLFELLHSIFTQHYKRFSFMSCHTLRLKVKITLTTAL